MENTDLFNISDDGLETASKLFNRDQETLLEDVKILKDWIKTQPHLPEILDDRRIQNFLFLNKCRIEKAKQRIDMYYTIRTQIPDFYEKINPKFGNMKEMMDIVYWTPVPKLTEELHRVIIHKIHNRDKVDRMKPQNIMGYFINIQELRLKEDNMFGDIIVFDLEGITVSYAMKWTPSKLTKSLAIYEKVFSTPLKGIYLLNVPSFIHFFLKILKSLMKPKLFERIHLCRDTSILDEKFSKELLPKDYGGEGKSLAELQELLKLKLVEYQHRFDELDTLRVNESLRPKNGKKNENLRFHGNFGELNFD